MSTKSLSAEHCKILKNKTCWKFVTVKEWSDLETVCQQTSILNSTDQTFAKIHALWIFGDSEHAMQTRLKYWNAKSNLFKSITLKVKVNEFHFIYKPG